MSSSCGCSFQRNPKKPNNRCICGCSNQRVPLTERNKARKSLTAAACGRPKSSLAKSPLAKSPLVSSSVRSPCRCNSSFKSLDLEDDNFWRTFRSVKREMRHNDYPHKTVRRVVPVYKRNVKLNQTLHYPDLERSIFDGIPENRTVSRLECNQVVEMMGLLRFNKDHNSCKTLSDRVQIAIRRQNANILPYGFLGKKNDALIPLRAAVINWLVNLQQFLVAEPAVLFMAIRLFDKLLAMKDVPESKFQLYGMVTFWIALKYEDSANIITAPYLLLLCHNRFCVDYLLKTEKNIVDFFHSNLVVDDPRTLVDYYIQLFKNPNPASIKYASYYLLELLALDNNCNSYAITIQASAAVYFAIRILNYDDFYWYNLRDNPGYHSPDEFCGLYKILMEYVLLSCKMEYWHRASYKKFSKDKYQNISMVIERKVNTLK